MSPYCLAHNRIEPPIMHHPTLPLAISLILSLIKDFIDTSSMNSDSVLAAFTGSLQWLNSLRKQGSAKPRQPRNSRPSMSSMLKLTLRGTPAPSECTVLLVNALAETLWFWSSTHITGHVLHLRYFFQIFWTLSSSFMCAHSPDALDILHCFLPEHQRCFFSDILDAPRTCGIFDIFILDILYIQQLICLCTFSWCSKSSAFFQDIYLGHVLHLTYLFRIFRTFRSSFRTFSSSFICAHSADAPEVLHVFFRIFTRVPGLFYSDIPGTPRTSITFDIFNPDNSTPGTCITFGIFISKHAGFVHSIFLISQSNLLIVYNYPPSKSLHGVQLTG